jgi:uncharacterized protein (DUF1810 family)
MKRGTNTLGDDMSGDPYDLARFVDAQEGHYAEALTEIRSGQKRSHWMWYIFPQFDGLGSGDASRTSLVVTVQPTRTWRNL